MAFGKAFAVSQSAILLVKVWTSGLMCFIVRLQLFFIDTAMAEEGERVDLCLEMSINVDGSSNGVKMFQF